MTSWQFGFWIHHESSRVLWPIGSNGVEYVFLVVGGVIFSSSFFILPHSNRQKLNYSSFSINSLRSPSSWQSKLNLKLRIKCREIGLKVFIGGTSRICHNVLIQNLCSSRKCAFFLPSSTEVSTQEGEQKEKVTSISSESLKGSMK